MNSKTIPIAPLLLLCLPQAAFSAALPTTDNLIVNLHADALSQPNGTRVSSWGNPASTAVGDFIQGTTALQPVFRTNVMGSNAVEFNGTTFLLSSQNVPSVVQGNNSWTMETWINNPQINIPLEEVYFQWGRRGGPDGTNAHAIYWDQGLPMGEIFSAVSHWGPTDMSWGIDGVRDASRTPPPNTWHHIAITFNGSLEIIYVNGAIVNAETKILAINQGHAALRFALGGAAYSASTGGGNSVQLGFTGFIAALRMYTVALTPAEISAHYQAGIAAQVPEPTAIIATTSALVTIGAFRRRAGSPSCHA